jgi:hypothetical protein
VLVIGVPWCCRWEEALQELVHTNCIAGPPILTRSKAPIIDIKIFDIQGKPGGLGVFSLEYHSFEGTVWISPALVALTNRNPLRVLRQFAMS